MQWRIKVNITARWYNWDKKTWTWNPSLMCTPRNAKKTLQSPSKASRWSQVPSWQNRQLLHQLGHVSPHLSETGRTDGKDSLQLLQPLSTGGGQVPELPGQCGSEGLQHSETEQPAGSTERGTDFRTGQVQTDREKEAAESSKKLQDAQQKYDKQLEQLLKEQSRLRDAKDLLEARLSVNDATLISLRNGCAQQVGVLLGWMMTLKHLENLPWWPFLA